MDQAFVHELPDFVGAVQTKLYDTATIDKVYSDAPENGFSIIVIPAFSEILVRFALDVTHFKQFAAKPLIGWVTGAKLEDLLTVKAKVFDGIGNVSSTDKALVMHVSLPPGKFADIGIVNIFDSSGKAGDQLQFDTDALDVTDVRVNGKKMRFADYLVQNKVDLRWPLVGDYHGAMVNSSFMAIDDKTQTVKLLAPVFREVSYQLARPMGDYRAYLKAFDDSLPKIPSEKVAFTCNCIFNYKYGELDGRKLDHLNGPFVFGEIAYQLVNQTLVYLTIEDRT
jgi:hypothetical protein